MHETSLARQILGVVLEHAAKEKATRVVAVRGWVAETESLSRESLDLHFRAHAAGTMAEGAVLDLDLRHVEARCADCETVYLPEHHLILCPDCGGNKAEVLGETGLGIEAIEVAG